MNKVHKRAIVVAKAMVALLMLSSSSLSLFGQGPIVQLRVSTQTPYESPVTSNTGCSGTVVYYQFVCENCTINTLTYDQTVADVGPPGNNIRSVTWQLDGTLTATYSVQYNGNPYNSTVPAPSFDVIESSAGTVSGPSLVCSNSSGSLSANGDASGAVTWQKCTSGCSTSGDSGWTNTTGAYSNLTTNTQFRVKLNSTTCGEKWSPAITVEVQPLPTQFLLSGPQSSICDNPSVTGTLHLQDSETSVTYRLYKNGSPLTSQDQAGTGSALEWTMGIGTYFARTLTSPPVCASVDTDPVTIATLSPGQISYTTSVTPSICQGSSIQLDGTVGNGLKWLDGSNNWNDLGDPVTVSPSVITTYRLVGYETNCGVERNIDVQVQVTPTVGQVSVPSGGATTRCKGSGSTGHYVVSATNASGTPPYTWSIDSVPPGQSPGTVSNYLSDGSSVDVNWNSGFSGTAKLTVVAHGCNGSSTSSNINITVVAPPTTQLLAGPAGVCSGTSNATIVLQSSEGSDVQYRLFKTGVGDLSLPQNGANGQPLSWNNMGQGTYTATAERTGCAAVNMQNQVVVGTLTPMTLTITTNVTPTICSGNFIELTAGGAHNVAWSSIPSGSYSMGNSLNVNPGQQTTYTATGEDNNCNTTVSDSEIVFVNPIPIVAISSTQICSGETTNIPLSCTNLTGASFTWSVSQAGITGTSPQPTPVSAGSIQQTLGNSSSTNKTASYSITATKNNCIGTGNSEVIVKPRPAISGSDKNIFSGSATDLSVTSSIAGTTISWTASPTGVTGAGSGNLTMTGTGGLVSQTINTSGSGNGQVSYSITPSLNSCQNTAITVLVTVFHLPEIAASTTVIIKGSSVQLNTTNSFDTYQWYRNAVTTNSTATLVTKTAGSYYVAVTKSGLSAQSAPVTIGDLYNGQNKNFIVTDLAIVPGLTTSAVGGASRDSVSQSIQYFDGLGRPAQSVSTQASPQGLDLVVPNVYDDIGREYRKFLPVAFDNTGRYRTVVNAENEFTGLASEFYATGSSTIATDTIPYADTNFEASPLNRVLEQGAPGSAWQPGTGHTITKLYHVNGEDEVLRFNYDASSGLVTLAATNEHYGPYTLFANKTRDEHQNEVIEFTDKGGRTICKKVEYQRTGTAPNETRLYACTYYVYDDFGNLVVVLPPEYINKLLNEN